VKADADRFAKNVAPIIREIQSSGVASHRAIVLGVALDCEALSLLRVLVLTDISRRGLLSLS
jgi:hypothetical protein